MSISIRHNEVRDFTAELLKETCSDVSIETPLQRVTNETFQLRAANMSDEARVDVASVGNNDSLSKRFANYMLKGNVNAALRLLNEDFNTGVKPLTEETMQCLQSKHPAAQPS